MSRDDLEREYAQAKHAYHILGKRAAGKPAGSPEQRAYDEAKRRYHRLGSQLRRLKQQAE